MWPLLEISHSPPLAVWSNQLFLGLALALGLGLAPLWIERLEGIDRRRALSALVLLTVAELVGGRLHFAINYWSTLDLDPLAVLAVHRGGLHAAGAVCGLLVAVPLVQWGLGVSWRRLADGIVPTAGLCIAVARSGCFLHGCCFGTVCSAPWCMAFPRDGLAYNLHGSLGLIGPQAVESLHVHPLQLYFAAVGLSLTALGLWMHRRPHADGEIAAAALLVFATSSAGLEFLRAEIPGRVYWGPVPQLAGLAAGLAVLAAVALVRARQSRRGAAYASVAHPSGSDGKLPGALAAPSSR